MKVHMMPHVKVRPLTTYHILLVELEELPMELYALNSMNFNNGLPTYLPLG